MKHETKVSCLILPMPWFDIRVSVENATKKKRSWRIQHCNITPLQHCEYLIKSSFSISESHVGHHSDMISYLEGRMSIP